MSSLCNNSQRVEFSKEKKRGGRGPLLKARKELLKRKKGRRRRLFESRITLNILRRLQFERVEMILLSSEDLRESSGLAVGLGKKSVFGRISCNSRNNDPLLRLSQHWSKCFVSLQSLGSRNTRLGSARCENAEYDLEQLGDRRVQWGHLLRRF